MSETETATDALIEEITRDGHYGIEIHRVIKGPGWFIWEAELLYHDGELWQTVSDVEAEDESLPGLLIKMLAVVRERVESKREKWRKENNGQS